MLTASPINNSLNASQSLENPAPVRVVEDIAVLRQRRKAGDERIPAHGEFDHLLNAQTVDAFEISDSSNDGRLTPH